MPRPIRALAHRDFRLFVAGGLVSSVGSNLQLAALAWVVQAETGSALRTTGIAFVGVVPLLVFGPLAGVLADRFARRRFLVVMNLLQFALAASLWIAWETDRADYGTLFVLSLLGGILTALQTPAWQSLPAELVPSIHLPNAITLNSTQYNLARALGPMAAGAAIEWWSAGGAFLLNALSFIIVIGALAMMSPAPPVAALVGEGVFERWNAGLRYVRSTPGLVVAICVQSSFAFAAAPIVQLIPQLSQDDLLIGAGAYGVLLGALGIGAIVAAFTLGVTDHRVRPSASLAVGLGLTSLGLACLAAAPTYALAMVAMAIFGAAYVTVVAINHGAIQRLSDHAHRGRVTSVWLMTFGGCFPLGVITMGAAADRFGARRVLAIDAAIMACVLAYTTARHLLPRIDGATPNSSPTRADTRALT